MFFLNLSMVPVEGQNVSASRSGRAGAACGTGREGSGGPGVGSPGSSPWLAIEQCSEPLLDPVG